MQAFWRFATVRTSVGNSMGKSSGVVGVPMGHTAIGIEWSVGAEGILNL